MAGVQLTYSEIVEAARRLPAGQRRSLVEELTSSPSRGEVFEVVRDLRPAFQLPTKKQKRLSTLLQKGKAGELTQAQHTELDALIEEVLDKREAMAKAVGGALAGRKRTRNRNGTAAR